MEISFFEILANIDVIFRDEEVEIAKIGDNIGKRATQELFKYHIKFSVALLVSEIFTVKETPLFSDFSANLSIFQYNGSTCSSKFFKTPIKDVT